MKTGIFGGAFNPVHNGHIQLMNGCLDALCLDRIILIPTANPPHKSSKDFASKADRMNMLELVSRSNPKFEVSDIEFKREGKSYTFYTIEELKRLYPFDEFYLIVGSDQYLSFFTWYRPIEILKSATLCTMARRKSDYEKLFAFKKEHEELNNSIILSLDVVDVSSSEIRKRIKNKMPVSGMLPRKIEEYIKERGLYV